MRAHNTLREFGGPKGAANRKLQAEMDRITAVFTAMNNALSAGAGARRGGDSAARWLGQPDSWQKEE